MPSLCMKLEIGGGIAVGRTVSAKDYGPKLEAAGFYQVIGSFQKGDVIVIQAVGTHVHGHMAIYHGDIWVSDYKQPNGYYPAQAYRDAHTPYKVYRHW